MDFLPNHQGPAGGLRAVIGTHRLRASARQCSTVLHPGHVWTRNPEVYGDVYALVAEVINHRGHSGDLSRHIKNKAADFSAALLV